VAHRSQFVQRDHAELSKEEDPMQALQDQCNGPFHSRTAFLLPYIFES